MIMKLDRFLEFVLDKSKQVHQVQVMMRQYNNKVKAAELWSTVGNINRLMVGEMNFSATSFNSLKSQQRAKIRSILEKPSVQRRTLSNFTDIVQRNKQIQEAIRKGRLTAFLNEIYLQKAVTEYLTEVIV